MLHFLLVNCSRNHRFNLKSPLRSRPRQPPPSPIAHSSPPSPILQFEINSRVRKILHKFIIIQLRFIITYPNQIKLCHYHTCSYQSHHHTTRFIIIKFYSTSYNSIHHQIKSHHQTTWFITKKITRGLAPLPCMLTPPPPRVTFASPACASGPVGLCRFSLGSCRRGAAPLRHRRRKKLTGLEEIREGGREGGGGGERERERERTRVGGGSALVSDGVSTRDWRARLVPGGNTTQD
jgi:hypothetical protein